MSGRLFLRGMLPLFALIMLAIAGVSTAQPSPTTHCAGTPRNLVSAGMSAVIAPNLGPLNLRSLPAVSTGIENQLYGGHAVTILSGPSCNGGLAWWRVETRNGQRGWLAAGDWSRYWLMPARATREIDPLLWTCPLQSALRCPTR